MFPASSCWQKTVSDENIHKRWNSEVSFRLGETIRAEQTARHFSQSPLRTHTRAWILPDCVWTIQLVNHSTDFRWAFTITLLRHLTTPILSRYSMDATCINMQGVGRSSRLHCLMGGKNASAPFAFSHSSVCMHSDASCNVSHCSINTESIKKTRPLVMFCVGPSVFKRQNKVRMETIFTNTWRRQKIKILTS